MLFGVGSDRGMRYPIAREFAPNLCVERVFVPGSALVMSTVRGCRRPFIVSRNTTAMCSQFGGSRLLGTPRANVARPNAYQILCVRRSYV